MRLNEVDLNNNSELTFRFRSVNTILRYDELKNLEMYFCPFENEDDVFEGALNLYWKGDEILWDNFIGHYILIVWLYYTGFVIDDKNRNIPEKIEWRYSRSKLNLEGIIQKILEEPITKTIKKFVMSKEHKVESDELRLYLNFLHGVALKVIMGVTKENIHESKKMVNYFDYISVIEKINWEEEKSRGSFRALNQLFYKQKERLNLKNLEDWQRWFFIEFPNDYFDILDEMVFPKWFIVSFCRSCTNMRNWAQYGDSNKGVCLIYRTHKTISGKGLRIKTCHEYSSTRGKIFENHIEPLCKVEYSTEHPEINFFEMLGNLSGHMMDEWFHDRNGNASKYYVNYRDDLEGKTWRQNYWEIFKKVVTRKGEAWDGLEEERVILENSFLVDYESSPLNRKIRYDFEELRGIIWGCNINKEDKNKIKTIINELCVKNNRTDFEFYQAVRDPSKLEIWIEKEFI